MLHYIVFNDAIYIDTIVQFLHRHAVVVYLFLRFFELRYTKAVLAILFCPVCFLTRVDINAALLSQFPSGGARSFLGGTHGKVVKKLPPSQTTSSDSNTGTNTQVGKGPATKMMSKAGRRLQIATWNIAAINNNPFEYWITYKENPAYEQLMVKVEEFLEAPGDKDVLVPQVFTEEMLTKLDQRFTDVGWTSVRDYWDNDFSKRTIVEGFIKDKTLGSKRLASMPDRITNTINTADGQTVFRPTIINMYEGDLATQDMWWSAWEAFMFDNKVKIKTTDGVIEKAPYSMLQRIKKAKYPEITLQEEEDSLPLQALCGAIFDSILVHMMNTVSQPSVWQPLKRTMVENLNKKKIPRTLSILADKYMDSDIITLQEVSGSFIDQARDGPLGRKFHIVASSKMDAVRDQNSVVCLNRATFPAGASSEISDDVQASFPAGVDVPVAPGDILAVTATSIDHVDYVIASFHGDTNGLATKPVLDAIVKTMETTASLAKHRLIFGLDANTYEHSTPGKQQDVLDFGQRYVHHGLSSCWGDVPNPSNYTTFNARTYLQPQLNKACRKDEKREKGDVNPKDFILFPKKDFTVLRTWKDNTGDQKYVEDMAFPTLQFPSDHGILATVIVPTSTTPG